RVLTTRIAWLIQTGRCSPPGVMAVTFTNKASKEMQTRLAAMLPINTRGMWIGTFHGLCNRLLRAHHRDAGLPELFQIFDQADQLAAIKRVLKQLNIDTERFPPRTVQNFINKNKEAGLRAAKVDAWDPFSRRLNEIYAEYDTQCQREGVVDFAELLLRSYELLTKNALLREHYQMRFQQILVDEFQDTSQLQYAWLKLLKGAHAALFAVGDDDQSIYAFRGAYVGNMGQLMEDLALPAPIKLTQNYRSHSNILDAANAVIAHNSGRLGKDLWTAAGAGEPLRHFKAWNDTEEARFIVEEARTLHAEGERYSDIAVLYRANAQSRAIEHALFSAGVPYRVYGGLRFFERTEIKHALAYLRLLANPEDDNAFLRVVNFPARGIGARSLELVDEAARVGGISLWQAACGAGAGTGKKGLAAFVGLIEAMQSECAILPLQEKIAVVIERSGLLAHYRHEKDGADRVENLEELTNAAVAFAAESEDTTLVGFLGHAALEAGEHEAVAGQDAVQLMTVHAAKGLEFHAVFLSGLEEGLFPHENASAEADGVEEERRLMYVAITRARRRLYLLHAESRMLHGQVRYGIPSRFLDEIPPALIQSFSVPRAPSYAGVSMSAAPEVTVAQAENQPFKIGARVTHARYGDGVVGGYQDQGADTEIRVSFPKIGDKWFIVTLARLTAR
ncbi:MAG: DNA helicase II, partial [Betaproteobacteria bacterium]